MGEVIKSSWVSEKRLQEYLDAAGGDESRASDLYAWNAEVSSALFEVIHHFEVLLRNTIIHQLEKDGPGPNVPPGSPWVQNEGAVAEVSARLARLKKTRRPHASIQDSLLVSGRGSSEVHTSTTSSGATHSDSSSVTTPR